LVVQVERDLGNLEEELRNRLPEIVRTVHRGLFQLFNETRSPSSGSQPTVGPGLVGVNNASNQAGFHDDFTFDIAAADDQLAAYWPGPFGDINLQSYDDTDSMFGLSLGMMQNETSDSGYHSVAPSSGLDLARKPNEEDSNATNSGSDLFGDLLSEG
jgi:hypothetical protein